MELRRKIRLITCLVTASIFTVIWKFNATNGRKNSTEIWGVTNKTLSFIVETDDIQVSALESGEGFLSNATARRFFSQDPVNYFLDPDQFTDTIADCLVDDRCHIFYRHILKTGGSTIEHRLRPFRPYSQASCCDDAMLRRFNRNKKFLCQANFSSFQFTNHDYFETVVSECMQLNPSGSRAIALVSFRDPVQTCISQIHQLCNRRGPFPRSTELLQACNRCSFKDDYNFWVDFVEEFNEKFRTINQTLKMIMPNVKVMTIETPDIDKFFKMLRQRIPTFNFTKRHVNRENLSKCSFEMASEMIHGLAPSQEIYRNLIVRI